MSTRRGRGLFLLGCLALALSLRGEGQTAGNCGVAKVWTTSEVLTAADLNNSMTQAATTNSTPGCVDDYSASVSQMQAATNPYPGGAESQATSLAGELERLRYQVKLLTRGAASGVYWYQPPVEANRPNFLLNGSMEKWGNGTTAAPDGWVLAGAGMTIIRDAGIVRHGTYAAGLTRVGTDGYLGQAVTAAAGGGTYFQGRTYTVSAWVRATVASRARIALTDGTATSFSAYHTGGGAWELLTVTRTLSAAASALEARLYVDSGDTQIWVDAAILTEGWLAPVYTPHPLEAVPTSSTGARITNSLNISLTTAVLTPLTFDTERFDTSDFHSTTSNTNRLTIPTGGAGKYLVGCTIEFASNATGDRIVSIRKISNGGASSFETARSHLAASSVGTRSLAVTSIEALVPTDYMECLAFQDSGGALNVTSVAQYSPEFWLYWLGL